MMSPRTTFFAICSAVGIYLWDLVAVPYWINIIGKVLCIVGNTGIGVSAADQKQLSKHAAEIEQLKEDTNHLQ